MSKQLERIIAKQPPDIAKLTRAVLAKVRAPDDRASHVINSIATYRKWINLYFYEGDNLPDPEVL